MGDRGNIRLVYATNPGKTRSVWFYTHWRGSDIVPIVARALAKRWRWDDPSYLARIIFDELSKGHQGEETSFGIDVREGDNEYPVLTVHLGRRCVRIGAGPWESFEAFVGSRSPIVPDVEGT